MNCDKNYLATTKNFFVLFIITFFILMKIDYTLMWADQAQYLIAPFARIKPNFAPNDWYVWQTTHYYPAFTWLIVFINKYMHFELSLFGLWFVYMFFFLYSVQQLIKSLIDDERVFFFCCILIFFSLRFGWGNSAIFADALIPSSLVVPFFIMSIVFFIKNAYLLSGLFLGIVSIFQPQFAVLGIILYGIYFVLKYKSIRINNIVKFGISFSCLALFPFWCTFTSFFSTDQISTVADYKILLERSPHALVASSWGIAQHTRMFIISCLSFYAAKFSRYKLKNNILFVFSCIILFLCGLAAFFTEVFLNVFIVRLYFWRFASFLMLFGYIYGAVLIIDFLDQEGIQAEFAAGILLLIYFFLKPYGIYAAISLILFVCFFIAQIFCYFNINKKLIWINYALFLTPVSILAFVRLPYKPLQSTELQQYIISFFIISTGVVIINNIVTKYNFKGASSLACFILPFITLNLFGINQFVFRPDHIHPYKYEKVYEEVKDWVINNTKPEDNFIIPPRLEGFRLRTGRGILVNWKGLPLKGYEVREWKRRMDEIKNYDKLTPAKVKNLAQEYKMTHFLTYKSYKSKEEFLAQGFKILFQNNYYILYNIPL